MSATRLPQFSDFDPTTFVDRLDQRLQANLKQIDDILENTSQFSWENLMQPLEAMENELARFWFPLSHLHAVVNSKPLRDCYQACLPKLSAYESAIGQNQALYTAMQSLDKSKLEATQCKIIDDALLDFKLSGVALSTDDKRRFEAIQERLSALSNAFENNVLDAGQAYTLHITDERRLSGLPDHALARASELAKEKSLLGWVLNLEIPCYLAVVTYADDRALREQIYQAYVTRASDAGPLAGQFDNTAVMDEILALRHEKALLLEYKNYAELSLATKMAQSTAEVMHFLIDLNSRAQEQAQREFKQLTAFAAEQFNLSSIAPWDIAYLSEKMMQAHYAISQEALRPYFPVTKVMEGLFTIVNRLYGMTLQEVKGVDSWHPEVVCYQIVDNQQAPRGYIYVDLFARQNKRGGAWMDSCQTRYKRPDDSMQLPIATLTCNFAKPPANKPATLSHDEVLTLFHEFGHCLHHVLSLINYVAASGVNGVEWDAVELPSQFFENWCWQEEALHLVTAHVETGQPLPKDKLDQLLAAKNFQSAMALKRQLEFSLFDFRIHLDYLEHQPTFIQDTLSQVRHLTAVVPIADFNRFQHSFTHIFSGGYAAGYYSYKWAEVLSSDAFSKFEEEGIFNATTGKAFLNNILEVGGSRKAAEAFVQFRGREAKVDALLHHSGIE